MSCVAVNTKYYKDSSKAGIAHVNRDFKVNKNCTPELEIYNFGDGNLSKKYEEMKLKVEADKGKKIKKFKYIY